jgi:hypothetical protein
LHHFHARGVPSLTTFCEGRARHTALDTLDSCSLKWMRHVHAALADTLDRIERAPPRQA